MPRTNALLDAMDAYPMLRLDQARARIRAAGLPLHDFGLGDPVEETPRFIREALRDAIPERSRYPTVKGGPAVRQAIAGYMARRFGVTLDPETRILPTSGSKEAVFHLPLAVIDPTAPDRTVLFPDPSYPAYERGTRFAGGTPHAVALGADWRFRPWELPARVLDQTRLIFINSPHNPSGVVTPLEDLRRLHALCVERDILLVADECYADLYDEAPPPSALQVGTENVVVVHSLSKRSGMTAYRSGFLAGDERWIAILHDLRLNLGTAPQAFVNAAAVAAWSDDAHAEQRRLMFSAKRACVRRFLEDAGFAVAPGGATFYLWFQAPGGDDIAYAARLEAAGIVVTPGAILGSTPAGKGWVRLAMAPDLAGCQAAIAAWKPLL
ncbi:MAG: aminotransferase class I/II-fold pyridoxal phosphate-dependent enzyme [Pseudomonadota bacterium]